MRRTSPPSPIVGGRTNPRTSPRSAPRSRRRSGATRSRLPRPPGRTRRRCSRRRTGRSSQSDCDGSTAVDTVPRAHPTALRHAVGRRALDAPSADREADPIAEQLTRRTRASRHDSRARRYALSTVRPSPARAAAPEPEAWLSITDLGELLDLEVQFWADELDVAPAPAPGAADAAVAETVVSTPAAATGNVTLLPSPAAPEVPAPPARRPVPEPARQAPPVRPPRRPPPPRPVPPGRCATRP